MIGKSENVKSIGNCVRTLCVWTFGAKIIVGIELQKGNDIAFYLEAIYVQMQFIKIITEVHLT